MKLNRLDEVIAKRKSLSLVMFILWAISVCIVAILGIRCCLALVKYSSTSSFDSLFLDPRVTGYFLGRFVFNVFELGTSPFGYILSFFKSITLVEVFMFYLFMLLIFQDPQYKLMKFIKRCMWIILVVYVIGFCVFCVFLILATQQLTAANAFNLIKEGAFYVQYIYMGVVVVSIIMVIISFLYSVNLDYFEQINQKA